jgi:hypothetical protein
MACSLDNLLNSYLYETFLKVKACSTKEEGKKRVSERRSFVCFSKNDNNFETIEGFINLIIMVLKKSESKECLLQNPYVQNIYIKIIANREEGVAGCYIAGYVEFNLSSYSEQKLIRCPAELIKIALAEENEINFQLFVYTLINSDIILTSFE